MDFLTFLGVIVGLGGIASGLLLGGASMGSLFYFSTAFMVASGTAGAVLISATREDLARALALFKLGFRDDGRGQTESVMKELVEAAEMARNDSILALEKKLASISDPFMHNVFKFMSDGVDAQILRETFGTQLSMEEQDLMAGVKIYRRAGWLASMIGIIIAVLSYTHLNAGLTVSACAVIYGMGLAAFFFFPLGSKIKRKVHKHLAIKHMILEGALGIVGGLNAAIVAEKLKAFISDETSRAA